MKLIVVMLVNSAHHSLMDDRNHITQPVQNILNEAALRRMNVYKSMSSRGL
jgi:hypothetical protein